MELISITIIIAGALWIGLLFAAFFGKILVSLLSRLCNEKFRETVEADAIVLNIEQTGLYINNKPQVKLQMQVKPRKGRNFVTEINDIEDVRTWGLKAGSVVKVKYNPKNCRKLLLIKAA